METKSRALEAIAGFVEWFGRRWIAPSPAEEASTPTDAGSHVPKRPPASTDTAASAYASSCPPEIRGKLYANPGALPIHLKFRGSPRVPGGIDKWCVGFDDAHSHYRWHSSWSHPTTGVVASTTWPSTTTSVSTLRETLQVAVAVGSVSDARDSCLAILKWGGVSGAVGFVNRTTATLPAYLIGVKPLLNVGATTTAGITAASVLRFDAGMTKIHAIFDSDWTPIYDSRVGAAIAMLFELYYADTRATSIAGLAFPSGPARGSQIRDPGYFPDLSHAPQFYTSNVPPHVWAQFQLKLAWVIEALLNRYPSLFASLSSSAARAHAFEATLFMLGYDLRCFVPAMRCLGLPVEQSLDDPRNEGPRGPTRRRATWVPTGISMPTVASLFLDYATARRFTNLSCSDFISWQTSERSPAITSGYARANATILRPLEFDLCERTEKEIRCICDGGEAGLRVAMAGRDAPVDERERVCLVDALLYGMLKNRCANRQEMRGELLAKGIAFTAGSADTLINVGRSVGRFFGLLDAGGASTAFYHEFFADADWQDVVADLLA